MAASPPKPNPFEIAHTNHVYTPIKTEDNPVTSIEDVHIKAEPDVYIKPEPKDDDDLEYLFNGSPSPAPTVPAPPHSALSLVPNHNLSLSVRPNPQLYIADKHKMPAPNSSFSKVKQADGTVAPTICNENLFALHPHHHRLNCGHDIMTQNPEGCAVNCHLGTQNDNKPTGKAFICPHPYCKHGVDKLDKAFISVKAKGYRRCILSHIYGVDLPFDNARLEEKAQMAAVGRPNMVAFKTFQDGAIQDRYVPKRSVSPDLNDMATKVQVATRARAKAAKQVALRDPARNEDEAIEKYGLDAILTLKQAQKGITRNEEGRILTAREEQTKRTAKVMKELEIDGTEAFRQKRSISNIMPNKRERRQIVKPDKEVGYGQEREWPHAHLQGHFDGVKSIRNQEAGFFSMPSTRRDAMLEQESGVTMDRVEGDLEFLPRDKNDADFKDDEIETHCICKSREDGLMFPCSACAAIFHPGCCGFMFSNEEDYDGDLRDGALAKDARIFRTKSLILTCLDCAVKSNNASKTTSKRVDPPSRRSARVSTTGVTDWKRKEALVTANRHEDEGEDPFAEANIYVRQRVIAEREAGIHKSQPPNKQHSRNVLKILHEQVRVTASARADAEIAELRATNQKKRKASPEADVSKPKMSRTERASQKAMSNGRRSSHTSTPVRRSTTQGPQSSGRKSRKMVLPNIAEEDKMEE